MYRESFGYDRPMLVPYTVRG